MFRFGTGHPCPTASQAGTTPVTLCRSSLERVVTRLGSSPVTLFAHHQSAPAEIMGRAAALVRAADSLDSVRTLVRQRVRGAQGEVEGALAVPLGTASAVALRSGEHVVSSAQFCAGVLTFFATAVAAFDAGVDRLNQRWCTSTSGVDQSPVVMGGRGALLRQLTVAHRELEHALDHAAARAAAMLQRGPNNHDLVVLTMLGVMPATSPLTDPSLRSALDSVGGRARGLAALSASARRDWWADLTVAQRSAVIAAYPALVGGADGLPAQARDEANRLLLAADRAALLAVAADGVLTEAERRRLVSIETIVRELDAIESRTDPITHQHLEAQLYIYDPDAFDADGRAAIATGDLDTADHVAFLVPGLGTTVSGMTGGRAVNVYSESRWSTPDAEVAVLDWVGYDAPSGGLDGDVAGVVNQDLAREGARLLALDVATYRISRADDLPHVTVAGNSYGSTAAAIAADEFDLAADDLILTGSPGAGRAADAADLTTGRAHTWVGSASHDAVSSLGVTGWVDPSQAGAERLRELGLPIDVALMGNDPSEDDFHAQRFEAEDVDRLTGTHLDPGAPQRSAIDGWNLVDHGRYYDADTESLYNVGAIVTGQYEDVEHADPRHDPWWTSPHDPERDRTPTGLSHRSP